MPISQDVEHESGNSLPNDFQTGFVQAMLFAQGIVEPTARDYADAIRALQQYRLVANRYAGEMPRYHGVARKSRNGDSARESTSA